MPRVVVCTKETPDTAAKVEVDAGGAVTWGDAPLVINPWDEYAVEEALLLKEEQGADSCTVLGMGTEATREALKHALAMGCDDAVLLTDAPFESSDALVAAEALSKAIVKLGDVQVALFGRETSDGNTGEMPGHVGRRLGWNVLTYVSKITTIDFDAGTITVERLLEQGKQTVESKLPVVLSVVKEINEPRYPSFMGIRKASKAEIPVWGAADIGFDEATQARVVWQEVYALPPRDTEVEVIDADSVADAAEVLVDRLIEEKVI